MTNNFDGATGRWDVFDENDPASTAANDQLLARAHETISSDRSFILIAIPGDDTECVYECASAIHGRDRADLTKALAQFLVRLWFDDVPHGSVLELVASIQLTSNFMYLIDRYMEEGANLD